ncbi:hypothetical protein EVAR_61487_1 [Eumeta japonica]|uniref:Uncharacterized protein n=1 Tax=Eumeta variegata TaxID=151549 RepID=A0A4C1ZLF9_EUMVA|nr:hypothetical protein EVAR_61487_1 [Eumeta japonica]
MLEGWKRRFVTGSPFHPRTIWTSKAIKYFSAPLVALLVAIFNAYIQNCYFPTAWKEAVTGQYVLVNETNQGWSTSRLHVILLYSAYVNDIPQSSTSVQLVLFAERFFDVVSNHPYPLLVSAVTYELPPLHHFSRRPRNVLIDPPDDLTVEVEKLIELNNMAIDWEQGLLHLLRPLKVPGTVRYGALPAPPGVPL